MNLSKHNKRKLSGDEIYPLVNIVGGLIIEHEVEHYKFTRPLFML